MNQNASINPKPKWRSRGLILGLIAAAALLVAPSFASAAGYTYTGSGISSEQNDSGDGFAVGAELTVDNQAADWSTTCSSGGAVLSQQWVRSTDNTNWTEITGETTINYTPVAADYNNYVAAEVRCNKPSPDGSYALVRIPGGGKIAGLKPVEPNGNDRPRISTTPIVGTPITVLTDGNWDAVPNPVFTYQWVKYNNDDCSGSPSNIVGATSNSYTPTFQDLGYTIKLRISATNAAGTTTMYAVDCVGPVVGQVPVNTAKPVMSIQTDPLLGQNFGWRVGEYAETTKGSWTAGTVSPAGLDFKYNWQVCAGAAATCGPGGTNVWTDVEPGYSDKATELLANDSLGATWSPPAQGDYIRGSTVRVGVRAENAGSFSAFVYSDPSPVLGASRAYPVSLTYVWQDNLYGALVNSPFFDKQGDDVEVGDELKWVSNGVWGQDVPAPSQPITYSYAWARCPAITGVDCDIPTGKWSLIPGTLAADSQVYTVKDEDAGYEIVQVVIGDNTPAGGGPRAFVSLQSAYVKAYGPTNTAAPSISGSAQVGTALSANAGTWVGPPAPSTEIQWQRADSNSGPWSNIAGADGGNYTPGESDQGKYLRIKVTATNVATEYGPYASVVANSAAVGPVAAAPAPEQPTITRKPRAKATSLYARFAFVGDEGASFQCALDGGAFKACSSQVSYGPLKRGRHSFKVRATKNGVTSGTSTYSWRIVKKKK